MNATGIAIREVESQLQTESLGPEPSPILAQSTSVCDDAETARRVVASLLTPQDQARTAEIRDVGYEAGAKALANSEEAVSRTQKACEEKLAMQKEIESLRAAERAAKEDLENQNTYKIALEKELESLRAAKKAAQEDLEKQRMHKVELEKERQARDAEEDPKMERMFWIIEIEILKKEIERFHAAERTAQEDLERLRMYKVELEKRQTLEARENAAPKEEVERLHAAEWAAQEDLEAFRMHRVELEKEKEAREAKVNQLNQENLPSMEPFRLCMENWVNSKSYEDSAREYKAYHFIKGYSDYRVAVHKMDPDFDLRKYRAFPGERMKKNGETLVQMPTRPPQMYFDNEERPAPPPEPLYSQDEPSDDELLDPDGDPSQTFKNFDDAMMECVFKRIKEDKTPQEGQGNAEAEGRQG